nr:MAG TPA: hypothetical protein [Caudoviricetes sp.]
MLSGRAFIRLVGSSPTHCASVKLRCLSADGLCFG